MLRQEEISKEQDRIGKKLEIEHQAEFKEYCFSSTGCDEDHCRCDPYENKIKINKHEEKE